MLNGVSTPPEEGLPPRPSIRWLFLDFNSYFASVEQQLHPEWRGKPLAVVPVLANTTCCIAASYEAKAFGIKTGTLVAEAKRLCPDLILVEAHHEKYVEFHHRAVAAVETQMPVSAVMSIDELAGELMGSQRVIENARALALRIRRTVHEHVGSELRCSIGIAPNRFLAKVASDMQKPNGLVILTPDDLPARLHALKLNDFPGIGRRMLPRFQAAGVHTSQQLCALSEERMQTVFGGVQGRRFWRWLRGLEATGEHASSERKSIHHSHVLPPELRSLEGAHSVLQRLIHRAAARLRKYGDWARELKVEVRWRDGTGCEVSAKFLECQDTQTLLETGQSLWARILETRPPLPPTQVTMVCGRLVSDAQRTLGFFDNPRRLELSKAMDQINLRYGGNSIYFGGMSEVQGAAPTRIAFNHIPEFDEGASS